MTPRAHCPTAAGGAEIVLDATKSRHLLKVLRLQAGAAVVVIDGAGGAYSATLLGSDRRGAARLRTGERLPPQAADSNIRTDAGQLLCAPAKMDWAVEKMTELGCRRIAPLLGEKTRHSVATRQIERWRRLAAAAAEQCGRATVPDVGDAMPLAAWREAQPDDALRILLSPRGEESLAATLRRHDDGRRRICLASGGESGFSATEERDLLGAGFLPARLGARVLRAETAALAALAVIQQIGDAAAPAEATSRE